MDGVTDTELKEGAEEGWREERERGERGRRRAGAVERERES